MAKDKKTPKTNNTPSRWSRFVSALRSRQGRFIFGVLLTIIPLHLLVSFLSFLVTGKHDQAVLENLGWEVLTARGNGIENWGGTLGAIAAEWCINKWLGVAVILFAVFVVQLGYLLISGKSVRPMLGRFVLVSLWVIWISLTLGQLGDLYDQSFIFLGGKHGYEAAMLLNANLGLAGSLLLLLMYLLILCPFQFPSTIDRVCSLFGLGEKLQAWRERRREAQALAAAEREAKAAEEAAKAAAEAQSETEELQSEGYESNSDSEEPQSEGYEDNPEGELDVETDKEAAAERTDGDSVASEGGSGEESAADDIAEGGETQPQAGDDVVVDPVFEVTAGTTETVEKPIEDEMPQGDYDPTADLSQYKFPTFDLLRAYDRQTPIDMVEQNANKEKIKQVLSDYGIEIQSIKATVGPTITLFEIVLVNGTRINKVKNLSDEIAMSIAAVSGIRIIAPIPGKCAIGIEVPNNDPQTVSMRECISSRAFQETKFDLPVALGKTITNEVFTFDLAKAPHLLVAGATGQGKSVGLNAIITSLLYKKHPSQLKIVLVDPKMVEFSIYKRIEKHYLAKLPEQENPIITDVTKTVDILKSLCAEMEDRYALVEDAGVRNIKEYNEKFIHRQLNPKKHVTAPIGSREGTNHRYLPYIVAIIDEYGDLIMTAGKEVELPIARIAQKARAVGIHMIIATQRPSAKIVTGIIKANFPARIAFRVSQSIDSNIILDQSGAQNLIGRGDLLYSSGNVPVRVQCAFVDTPEVDQVNRFIEKQQSYPTALILPEPKLQEGEGGGDEGSVDVDLNHLDSYFNEAAEMVVATGQGSTSMLQRKFNIGYARAGRLMDQLEAAGVVGPYSGSKARAVLVTSDGELQQILENLKTC